MGVGLDHRAAQMDQLGAQPGIVDLVEQVADQARIDAGGVVPDHRGLHQQVFAQSVQHLAEGFGAQAQTAGDVLALQRVDLDQADMTVGDQGQRDDACGGLGAVGGIAAHGGLPVGVRREAGAIPGGCHSA